jgi:exopolyphosphatase/pppGpp-phosphohydrolase
VYLSIYSWALRHGSLLATLLSKHAQSVQQRWLATFAGNHHYCAGGSSTDHLFLSILTVLPQQQMNQRSVQQFHVQHHSYRISLHSNR